MGLLDFNISEFASRLVRGGGVRGRIRPTLDDGVMPVVRVGDWTQSPYRTDERRFFACVPSVNVLAANFSICAIENLSSFPVVIESIEYSPRNAAVLFIEEVFVDRNVPSLTNKVSFASGEGSRNVGAALGVNFLPQVQLAHDIAAAVFAGFPVIRRTMLNAIAGPAAQNRADGFDFTLPPGCSYVAQAVTVNQSFAFMARIRAAQQALPS